MQTDQETEEYEDVEMSFEKRQLLIRPPIFSIICYVSWAAEVMQPSKIWLHCTFAAKICLYYVLHCFYSTIWFYFVCLRQKLGGYSVIRLFSSSASLLKTVFCNGTDWNLEGSSQGATQSNTKTNKASLIRRPRRTTSRATLWLEVL